MLRIINFSLSFSAACGGRKRLFAAARLVARQPLDALGHEPAPAIANQASIYQFGA
jgi:4'-phosphopantetheinyl transferase EntD